MTAPKGAVFNLSCIQTASEGLWLQHLHRANADILYRNTVFLHIPVGGGMGKGV